MELQPGPQLQTGSTLIPRSNCIPIRRACSVRGCACNPVPSCKPARRWESLTRSVCDGSKSVVSKSKHGPQLQTGPEWIPRSNCIPIRRACSVRGCACNPARSCNPFAISKKSMEGKNSICICICISISGAHLVRNWAHFVRRLADGLRTFQRFSLAPWVRSPRRGTIKRFFYASNPR
jgi:hypothetical protein